MKGKRFLIGMLIAAQVLVQTPVYAMESDTAESGEDVVVEETIEEVEEVIEEEAVIEESSGASEESSEIIEESTSEAEEVIEEEATEDLEGVEGIPPVTATGAEEEDTEAPLSEENVAEVTFVVKFIDSISEEEIASVAVVEGSAAEAPAEVPTHEGYEFTGWDCSFEAVTGDLVVKALYEEIEEEQRKTKEGVIYEYIRI